MDPLLLPIAEAGKVLGVSRSTMFNLVRAGEIESVCIGNRRLIPVAALREYVERLRSESRANPVPLDDLGDEE